ncbi:hypothetical protein LTR91_016823 [Friedmanniomyces endolithicus]|uniref:Rad4 beta-hairpin domain-containing protein n=1 Tax=Friedmanniomyces endolithicus TaxID=329885 RepID=A0AAN6K7M8_9PEZI|nr:hypothetical protein LTS02_015563 [Friedmanniomyces endolithicus]KAK0884511.1 hypothetical protein LTR87_001854 [Friedmanniomyces endolithicus]KAK0903320.1 hypothetical protein LTR57_019270 [Friedmanniomyces endolithicus]KAK0957903.1 hypothetical protein LTS01_022152 [Friedmanniomyces endolithicus]KAK0968202.1 hypothetical protein LTR91_016823 [Friedmanniomyces endolithicus]
MAPSRGKGKARVTAPRNNAAAGPSRGATRATRKPKDSTLDVYQDMLADAAVTESDELADRPQKRRRVAKSVALPSPSTSRNGKARQADESRHAMCSDEATTSHQQMVEASSDNSDESDFAFEDVDLEQPATAHTDDEGIADISINVDPNTKPMRQAKAKRKGASLVEKAHRLLVHKAHRNLEPLLTEKTRMYLRANTRESQFDRNNLFMDGLQQAVEQFRGRFRVTASGMRRPRWAVEGEAAVGPEVKVDAEAVDRSEYITASRKLAGSQDTGNQLFCALLRTVGVEARMVCSLQVLPFANATVKSTPQKPIKRTIFASASVSNTDHSASDASADDVSVRSSTSIGRIPPVRRRLGQPSFAAAASAPVEQKRSIRKLAYPVFWTEAFNAAHQKWIPCDPIVTATYNKPAKLEPPSSYDANQLSYVIAFEADGVAKDVTRRYAKAYNAKTRRQRVEATENGTQWFKKAMRLCRRRGPALDREQVEDAELAAKEAREGLPGNVLDFKEHPYYALERHLRRHEVLFPKREVGKVNAGTAAKPRMEGVFRRQDVVVCRSAEKWYRLGREVRAGEQGLKLVKAARRLGRAKEAEEDGVDGEEVRMTALYALHQTDVYVPPAVVDGRVPRNAYGNLDIYVPSMVPAGGVHLRHPLTQVAARQLRVDYADAVTGFSFKGRQGTAIIEGAVVAEMHAEAVKEVIEGLEREEVEERCRKRSLVALTLWARMVKGLGIRERVKGYRKASDEAGGAGGDDGEMEVDDESVTAALRAGARDDAPLLTAGRYTLEELLAGPAKTSLARRKRGKEEIDGESESEREEGGFERDEDALEEPEPPPSARRSLRNRRKVVEEDEADDEEVLRAGQANEEGGGFVTEDAVESGETSRGFMPDEVTHDHAGEAGSDGNDGSVPEEDEAAGGFLTDPSAAGDSHDGGGFSSTALGDQEDGGFMPKAAGSLRGRTTATALLSGNEIIADQTLLEHHADVEDGGEEQVETLRGVVSFDGPADLTAVDAVPDLPAATPPQKVRGGPATLSDHVDDQAKHETLGVMGKASVGDESDKDSLLSHDPDDEDAEPDWLESD